MKREFFNRLAAEWDNMPRPGDAAARIGAFADDVLFAGARRILDLGCGTGVMLPVLLPRLASETMVVEVDFAHEMLRRNAAKCTDGRASYVCADALLPPFADAAFDVVVCFNVLPHLGDFAPAIERLWRLVRPDGRLAVGHLMSSAELNGFHAGLSEAVNRDRLPPVDDLARGLRDLGARVLCAEDRPGCYCAIAERTS